MTTLLRQSHLAQLADPQTFIWAAGIEDTFITAPWPSTGRTLDEYELTGHYERWHSDIGLMGSLGIKAARYGIPWHRTNPRPGVWEWDFVDRTVDRLLEVGIEPILDLVHYGLPSWIENAYLHPDFADFMSEYARRVAEHLKGRVYAYTPLNEPRITAWYCGRLGWWPPFRRGLRGFVAVMEAVCRGICRSVVALRSVEPDALIAHVDATDIYEPSEPEFEEEARRRQEVVFLALDLISGRVSPGHPLFEWLLRQGMIESRLQWFQDNAVDLPLVGLNLYPMFTLKTTVRSTSGRARWRMPYATAKIIEDLGHLYGQRYGAPMFISETASVGSVARRLAWLRDSVAAVRKLRASGAPMIGYTWWPLFALVTWAYRQGQHPPAYYLKQMGLWDLNANLDRVATPLVKHYQDLVQGGTAAVGDLGCAVDHSTSLRS